MDTLHHQLFEPSHGRAFSFIYSHDLHRQWTHLEALRFLTIDTVSVCLGITVMRRPVCENEVGEDAAAKYGELFVLNRRWKGCEIFSDGSYTGRRQFERSTGVYRWWETDSA